MAAKRKPKLFVPTEPLRLDLGSGPRPAEGFRGVDIVPGVTDFCVDLCAPIPWPWADNSVDELRSSHVIEHLDAGYIYPPGYAGRIDVLLYFFDEAFRVAKPGVTFTFQWPALQSVRAFQDPTHRRFIPAETTIYLSREGRKQMGVEHYGAKCNWIGNIQPTIQAPIETDEDKAMALRADSSDEKQAWMQKRIAEQTRMYRGEWNFSNDFIAVMKAVK